jgi:hypothetical protein
LSRATGAIASAAPSCRAGRWSSSGHEPCLGWIGPFSRLHCSFFMPPR